MNILITGGTSGLGKAIIEKLILDKDNKVFFTYCHNKKSADDLLLTYSNSVAFQVDFSIDESVDIFIEQLKTMEIDVLVNNAYSGKAQGTYFHKTGFQEYQTAFHDNILPLIKITQCCVTGMRKRRFGKIINVITSYVMDVPPMGFSVYTATKAYIRQLSKSLSKEYGRFNITANCILPDYMQTPFGKVEDFQLEEMVSAHPLKKLLEPEEVADVIIGIIFASQQLNGVEIPINAAQHIV